MLWFKKAPKSKRLEDKVYLNEKSKYAAIKEELKQKLKTPPPLIVIYFFDETKNKIINMLEEQQIKYRLENEFAGDIQISNDAEIIVIKAKTLNKVYTIKQNQNKTEKQAIDFLFVEHYPIFSKEETVLNKIDLLTNYSALIMFYISLDEPLLRIFGSERITMMMQKLGLTESECIEHSFVTKSIINAQKKIEKKIINETETISQEDWFKKHHNQ